MKLLIYGDSISSGTHGEGAYLTYVAQQLKAEITNRSVGSSGLCLSTPNSMLQQLALYEDRAYDLVFIWHGSNDWYWGVPLKEFKESIRKAVELIRERNPKAKLLWAFPIYRYERPEGVTGDFQNAYKQVNKAGERLVSYRSAIAEAGIELGFATLDINSEVQFHDDNRDFYLEDKVHPNREGYKRIEKAIAARLLSLG